jgi:hypothetical protein
MKNPKWVDVHFRIWVLYDADVWGDPTTDPSAEDFMCIDLSQRLFDGNEENTDEALKVVATETVDVK